MTATSALPQPPLDMSKVQTFAFKMVADITACQMGTLITVGDRLGLFTLLADSAPVTSAEFASKAGIQERYAREWLSAMACHGYVAYDSTQKQFSMTPEQAFCAANPDSPFFLTPMIVMAQSYWDNLDLLTNAFQHGGGVPQERFGTDWRCGFERFSRTAFRNNLAQDWIPGMPQVDSALRAGGTVADVGCGNGQALIFLAQAYPEATLVGFDSYAPSVETANANAAAAGLSDRLRYEAYDASEGIPGSYDLITTFDVVHDMPRPRPALKQIRSALKSEGTYFVLEFNFWSDLQKNIDHPLGIGAFGYSASVNYCMTQALAVGGEGTGTCMGEDKMRELASEAGFTQFRPLDFPNNPFNLFYELRG